MAAFIKSLSRLLGSSGKPSVHLAAFGKHHAWIDHLDDWGLDTEALVAAKRLIYVQGISQNIDSGSWEFLEPTEPAAPRNAIGRLDLFRHDFLWHMPDNGPSLVAGRLWSSADGKGRDKYPMVVCAQTTDLPVLFATEIALPLLAKVQDKCMAAATAEGVRHVLSVERDNLRSHTKNPFFVDALSPQQLAAVATHPDMHLNHVGFHRIVYQFAGGMGGSAGGGGGGGVGLSAFRNPPSKSGPPRSEQLRLPTCGLSPTAALLFWLRFAFIFLDPSTPLLLFAPDQGSAAPWVDLIAGEPTPANIFCIKAGTKSLPFTSDIPYSLELPFIRAIDAHIAACAAAPEGSRLPPWPDFQ